MCCRFGEWYYGGRSDQIAKCCNKEPKFKTTKNRHNPNQRLEWCWLKDYMEEKGYTTLKEVRQECTLITKEECLEIKEKYS